MRNIIWILVALVIAGGGYLLYSGQTPQEAVSQVTEPAQDVDAPAALENASEAVEGSITDAVEATTDAAQSAVDAATDTAEAAVDAVTDASEATSDTVAEALEATTDALTETAETATEAATDPVNAASETAEVTTNEAEATTQSATSSIEAAPAAAETSLTDLLTVDGFDFDKVAEAIDGSDAIGDFQKTVLKGGLEQARNNPDLLREALIKVREALGL